MTIQSYVFLHCRVKRLGLSPSGAYRHLVQFPTNIHWRMVTSGERGGEGVRSGESGGEGVRWESGGDVRKDMEDSGGEKVRAGDVEESGDEGGVRVGVGESGGEGEGVKGDVGESGGEGVRRDLELEFCLPPSCYATVVLRELMKSEL